MNSLDNGRHAADLRWRGAGRVLAAAVAGVLCLTLPASCKKKAEELTLEEIEGRAQSGLEELLAKTVSKPWDGNMNFAPGKPGGTLLGTIDDDPRTFNFALASGDAPSADIMSRLSDYLFDYNYVTREWVPHIASGEVVVNGGAMSVVCTLRDDLYWSFYGSSRKEKVTSDDVIFWYNEIVGDPAFNDTGYAQQFMTMPDGEDIHIEIRRIDKRTFAFDYPRVRADPYLSVNMDFGPRFVFEPAKKSGGVEAVEKLFGVDSDPKEIPSMGQWFLTSYAPGVSLTYERNPDYWRKDSNGVSIPYHEKMTLSIVPDENTQYLLFKQGKKDAQNILPENLDDAVAGASSLDSGYTVFNNEGNLSAPFWSFNQNPKNAGQPFYTWFTKKEFRQAMSCLLNRERIISQVYRGLGAPMYYFFPETNPYYNADITLQYRYDVRKAEALLKSAGFVKKSGKLYDEAGRPVEFDLAIPADTQIYSDVSTILAADLEAVGIKLNIRQTDFQKIVEQLLSTYDWQSVFIAIGVPSFPSQGSNVWPSGGNLHLWYPLQTKPATDWEARVDYLYNEGCFTVDHAAASPLWDEYQSIILEQCPVIFLIRARPFVGVQNRWDFTNVFYDNRGGLNTEWAYFK